MERSCHRPDAVLQRMEWLVLMVARWWPWEKLLIHNGATAIARCDSWRISKAAAVHTRAPRRFSVLRIDLRTSHG